jgi:hypothetical protein
VYVLEHKTTALDTSLGSAYWEKLSIDTQVSIYVDGATMLGYEIAGCIYDVLKRPQHEPLTATPEDKREYTQGVGCSKCGGSGKPGAIRRGRGHTIVSFASVVETPECAACKGTGWKCDKDGKPQAPHLYAKQREHDETPAEFEQRLRGVLAESPDSFLIRGTVVRLDDELPQMRQDLIDAIKVERAADLFGLYPRNPDACSRYGQLCAFFDACANRASISDEIRFPRDSAAHAEPASIAA